MSKVTVSRTIQVKQYEPQVVTIELEGDDEPALLVKANELLAKEVTRIEGLK